MPLEQLTLSDEQVQDIVASLITSGDNADAAYDDTNDTLTVSLSDSISVNTLEAGTITDGADVSHSDELADSSDVSPIQSSSDVTVTDTQTGTVSDGEFLKNNNGNLTGGTVQTEPNVPNWTLDTTDSATGQTNFTVSGLGDFDIYRTHLKVSGRSVSEFLALVNINSSSPQFDYFRSDGNIQTGANGADLGRVDNSEASVILTFNFSEGVAAFNVNLNAEVSTDLESDVALYGSASGISGNSINSIKFEDFADPDWKINVFGRDIV
ncbi:hypothetical protein OSG_eHP6_00105 [environmental Halophage eHP-6]|nr:hypothetical protein OSG_eHP6_00105 [environmental Halophage eHP-6]